MSQRNRPCPCGSGRRYKHCCGSLSGGAAAAPGGTTGQGSVRATPAEDSALFEDLGRYREPYRGEAMVERCGELPAGAATGLAMPLSWAPPGLLVKPGFLDRAQCDAWRTQLANRPARPLMIKDIDPETGKPVRRLDPQRVTQAVDAGPLREDIAHTLVSAYRDVIAPHYGQRLDWMEQPGILKYGPGGKYDAHADDAYWDVERRQWIRSIDRDLSLLLYLNDDFDGGGLAFPNFGVHLRPEAGMLVAFPSDHRFLHAAEPVEAGERYALVCWATVVGSPRVAPTPAGAIR
ncbi:MAG: 2OG-Fe(II) oxygenase [Xanthomonadales bacterium]|nr:2OG-Fe(II) oxygenase [Xanthomonadales bacterium]